jgi:hypothetical protein
MLATLDSTDRKKISQNMTEEGQSFVSIKYVSIVWKVTFIRFCTI